MSHQNDSQILPLIENAVECRTELAPSLPGNRLAPHSLLTANQGLPLIPHWTGRV